MNPLNNNLFLKFVLIALTLPVLALTSACDRNDDQHQPGHSHGEQIYICPMHPEIVDERAGHCDICEMDLVPAESLGYATAAGQEEPLIIPATAPLITGRRAVVYVQLPNAARPTFEGREVVLGSRAASYSTAAADD